MFRLCIKQHFDAAHKIKGYPGDCAKLHGHSWIVEIFLIYPDSALNELGMAVDFKEVKISLNNFLPDHENLNKVYDFNPTAENIARYLYQCLKRNCPEIEKVRVWETIDCYAEYYPD